MFGAGFSKRQRPCVMLYVALLATLCVRSNTSPVLLTTQTLSQQHMKLIAHGQESQRRLLGALEATQSSVIDVNDTLGHYEITQVQSVPTLSLLDSVRFDNLTEDWFFTYETMAVDSSVPGQINRYDRVLYFTSSESGVQGSDTGNQCLQPGTDYEACLALLRADYVVLVEDPASANLTDRRDRIETTTWALEQDPDDCLECMINITVQRHAASAKQTLHLRIPHRVIRERLAQRRNSTRADSYAYTEVGSQPALDFGIGMMFLPQPNPNTNDAPPNNILVFDKFTVLENTFEQLAMTKVTSYSIATHVAFWTVVADENPAVRLVTIEYLLDKGHLLESIKIATNNGTEPGGSIMLPITDADCAAMQALVDDLENPRCITKEQLCKTVLVVEGSGEDVQTWATVVFPIPPWHTASVFQFNTMLFSNLTSAHNGRGMRALSTLNFFSSHAPRLACAPTDAVAFDVTRHVRAELYRGHALVAETITGTFSVFNDSALSSTEALTTLVLRPDNSAEALAYFERYTDEHIRLDELYMSHGQLRHNFPSDIVNRVRGTGSGRTELELDPELLARCPLQGASLLLVSPECVTTKDWAIEGQLARAGSAAYFVHQVAVNGSSEQADLAWLTSNVFGNSDPQAVSAFRAAALSHPFQTPAAAARKAFATIFWIWPVFMWPNTAPIGLVDRTVISLAWSIAP
jgi:hypothetical protein